MQEDRTAIESIITRLIIAHDPDYTKLTPSEKRNLEAAEKETETISHEQLKKELGL